MKLGLEEMRNVKMDVKRGRQHVPLKRSLTRFLIFCCIRSTVYISVYGKYYIGLFQLLPFCPNASVFSDVKYGL